MIDKFLMGTLQRGEIRQGLDEIHADNPGQMLEAMGDLIASMSEFFRILNRLANPKSMVELLRGIVEAACAKLDAESGTLFLYDPVQDELFSLVAIGDGFKEIRIPKNFGIAGAVYGSGEAMIVGDAYREPRFFRGIDESTGFKTRDIVCVPILDSQRMMMGVLEILNKRSGSFAFADQHYLMAIASLTAPALQNAMLRDQIEKERIEEAQIIEITTTLSRELKLQSLLLMLVKTANTILNADRSTLFLYDDKTDELCSWVALGGNVKEIRIPSHAGLAGYVFQRGELLNIPDAYRDPRFNQEVDRRTGYRTRSVLCMPVADRRGRLIGVIQALNKKIGTFTALDEKRLRIFGAQSSIAIGNARLFEEVLNLKTYYECIIESLSNGVITVNLEGNIVKCNQTVLQIMQVSHDVLTGTPIAFYFGADNPWVLEAIDRVLATGKTEFLYDRMFQLANEEWITVNLSVVPLRTSKGEMIGLTVVIEDITREKAIKKTFGRYLSMEVVDELTRSPEGLKLGGELREVTFLVSDLRGFASLTSSLEPHQTIDILNRFLETMVDLIMRYGGTIDEFQGDGILAFFGAPLARGNDAERAVECAVAMQNAMTAFNRDQAARDLPELYLGIGINTGQAIVGNIGSEKRAKYGAVGTAINCAYRIESMTFGGQILISTATYQKVQAQVHVYECFEVEFKGLDQPTTLHDVAGIGDSSLRVIRPKPDHDPMITLTRAIPITCFPLHGKQILDIPIRGNLDRASLSEAEILLERNVRLDSSFKMIISSDHQMQWSESYGKVESVRFVESDEKKVMARLKFTYLPGEVRTFLIQEMAKAGHHSCAVGGR